MRQATVCIDREALKSNLDRVKQLAPQAKILSMVKANAYGHGIKDCLAALDSSDAFGVACLNEALEVRQLNDQHSITLVEGIFAEHEMQIAIANHFEVMIHQQQQLQWLLDHQQAYLTKGLKVWVKLNSGMNRLGFKADEIIAVIQQLKALGFTCVLSMHFANADIDHPLSQQQIQQFLDIKAACAPILASCCNSAAIYKWPELHFDYVRPGIMLYGASPFADRNVRDLGLQPVMSFHAEIIAIQQIATGEYVGYGATFQATHPMTIAVVSIGYGDGYPRSYHRQNFVSINASAVAVVGRVSMDMIAIDITDLDVEIGQVVELWGKDRLVDDVAAANGSIGYELLCRLSQRPQRIVV
ncbi:alanine racemase [Acinetobacter calcoaceticus]|uniref:Alanine racemase n=1 Tax=Acinetobacter calcoaceticus TaxID=471 RepID=A0A4R1XAV8_ACICA|nr:alanine racemase [Acinetobacter calcoaceticus]